MMTEEGVEADLLSGGRKRSRRERIRERILKKTDKPEKPTAKEVKRDEDLNDFLKSPPEGDFLPRFPSPSRKSVPRINVALSPRRPDAQDVAIEDGTGHLAKDQLDALPDCPPWRSRRKGLTVRFAVTAPQIIGEGGEEAEAPSIWISQTRQSRSAPTSAHDEPHQTHAASVSTPANPRVVASNAVIAPAGEDFEPRILVRAPTGFGEARVGLDASTTTRNMKDAEFEPTVAGVDSTQPAVQSHSGLLSASAAGLKRKMLEEEARAFTSALRDPSPEPSSLQKNMTPPSKSQENLPAASTASYAQRGHSPSVSSNHLSPQGQSPSPSRPSSSSSHGSSHHATPPIAASPKRKPLPKPPTAESKEDALTGFRSRARCYYPLFVLAAEKTDPGLDAPLSRWMRAAAWWFLTAETNFKLLRKDLEEGANVLQITASRRHMQAVVDLAKTAWIVEDVVRDYAKADALDMSTPESIVRLIQSNPLSRFSRTLQYWQDLLKRFASLVAAIRRNGFMTSATEHVPLSAGIDTSIWLTSPISDPGTAHWLRCANPPWVRMDRTMTPVEPSDLSKVVPLKSTTNTFRIRSMFCQASGGFQDHDRTPTVPCILTIARRSGSYALVLFVASQDHGINVVLETDPVRGDGIEWQQTNSSVLFNFADGFRFLVRFQLADYIHFKDCYDLALRALNATVRDSPENANLGEKLIFRATSCAFERRSSEKIHSFPYEGEQKDCEIILFEKYEAVRGTSTTRKAHRGLRLSVMLSPQAGNLGILDVHLGGDKPILFHSAHEYSPPVVELMDSRRALLIIKFSRHRDFNRFYELLISLDHSINENTHYEQVPLRSFSVEPSSSEARTFLSGAPWGDVQVTMGKDLGHQPNHTTNTVRFASINICASSIQAVFAERLVEGRSQVHMGLNVANPTSLCLWRAAQQDMSVALRFRMTATNGPFIADQLLAQSRTNPTAWKYDFASLQDLHAFQKCLTGGDVLFDDTASSFLVTRGNGLRTKKEELGVTRLQLFQDDIKQLRQLLAYFENGQAMNFALDTNDIFERSNSKGKFSIRLVEAKVSLPADGENEQRRGFLCVEDIAEGRERDDITITFDGEDSRNELAQVLPSSVKKTSSLMGALHLR